MRKMTHCEVKMNYSGNAAFKKAVSLFLFFVKFEHAPQTGHLRNNQYWTNAIVVGIERRIRIQGIYHNPIGNNRRHKHKQQHNQVVKYYFFHLRQSLYTDSPINSCNGNRAKAGS